MLLLRIYFIFLLCVVVSSVSSASYSARAFGIGADTSIGKALTLCPNLIIKPYDFDSYAAVSEQIYTIFFKYTHQVQGKTINTN
jgi:nucleotidyltransferase/DNA polymerase involved in DNA repair